jgi:AcrR family transcriptional regulator
MGSKGPVLQCVRRLRRHVRKLIGCSDASNRGARIPVRDMRSPADRSSGKRRDFRIMQATRNKKPAKTAASAAPQRTGNKRRSSSELIVAAAVQHFSEHGVEHTTMEHIAAAANVSRRTIYHHFPSRDAVLQAAVEAYANNLTKKVEENISSELSFTDYLRECAIYIVREVPKEPFFKVHILDAAAIKSSQYYFTTPSVVEAWVPMLRPSYIRALRDRTINPDMELIQIIKWYGRILLSLLQHPEPGVTEDVLRKEIDLFFINALRHC